LSAIFEHNKLSEDFTQETCALPSNYQPSTTATIVPSALNERKKSNNAPSKRQTTRCESNQLEVGIAKSPFLLRIQHSAPAKTLSKKIPTTGSLTHVSFSQWR
jgi:hypothetical protein